VTGQEGPFYLDGLLYCHAPMRPVTWRRERSYQCGVCRHSVDALAAEVEVWEMATHQRPALGTGSTPYAERALRLAGALRWARWLPNGRYILRWLDAIEDQRGARVTGHSTNQGRWR
jgi:hypothetical protein